MFLEKWLNLGLGANRHGRTGNVKPSRRRPRPLFLETLEDRTVPTVLFAPQFGNETPASDGGLRINSPNVYVVLWGSSWGDIVSANSQQVFAATSGVLGNHYLDGLAQYGVTTTAHYKNHFVDSTPDPLTGFSEQSMVDEINTLIANNQLPDPANTPNMIVTMVTAPGITSGVVGAEGYNNIVTNNDNSIRYGYIWNGTADGDTSSLADHCSLVFSHEMAESMTSPGGRGFQVNNGNKYRISPPESSPDQICDFEAANYEYRSHGTLVQPYWSRADNDFKVTDGNAQTVLVTPIWNKNADGSQKARTGYDVTVTGGQLGVADSLIIGNEAPSSVQKSGGVFINLNREFFELDSDRLFRNLTATIANGIVHIDGSGIGSKVSSPLAGITINGRLATEVDVSATQSPVTINTAGTVDVGAGMIQNVGAIVSILGGSVKTDLTIDDVNNSAANSSYKVGSNTFLGYPSTAFVDINYSGLLFLRVNGGSGGNEYDVMNTPAIATTLSTGGGRDLVLVSKTSGPLSVLGQGGSDIVHIGHDGTVQDIGKAVVVSNSGGYSAVTVDDSSDRFAHTVIVYRQATLGVPSTIISGLPTGGDISLRSDALSSLHILAGSGGNTFRIHDTPLSAAPGGATTTVDTGAGNDMVTVDGTSGPLALNGDNGMDTVNFGAAGSVRNIMNTVFVTNAGGFSAVNVNDSTDASRVVLIYNNGDPIGPDTVIDGLIQNGDIVLRGDNLSSLLIQTGGSGNVFRIHNTPQSLAPGGVTTTVKTGAGTDMVTVDGTTGTLALNLQGGDDNVFIGSANGGLGRIQGAVISAGGSGNNALTFNDQLTTTVENFTLTVNQLTRVAADGFTDDMAPISFASFKSITLNVGSGVSAATVTGSSAGSTVTVNGYAGTPVDFGVDASADAILGPVIFNGQSAFDFAQYFDSGNAAPHTYTLSSTSIRRDGLATVYSNVGAILYAPTVGGSTFNVKSVALGGAYKIQAANGDHVTVGTLAPRLGGLLATILDQVNVVSYTSDDAVSLVFDDSGNTDTTPKHITFSGYDADGNTSMAGLTQIAVSWRLPSASSVTVRGGAADEIFSMQSVVATTPLTIVGGTGINTLDYSSYTTDVSVNLQTGAATDLAGITDPKTGRVTIQNVIGGSGNDTLSAGTRRSILIGGGGSDQLFGGSGQDILIGGTTDYTQPGLNVDALDAILREWNRTDLGFSDRMSDLLTGSNSQGIAAKNVVAGTAILLNSTTVHDDLAADVLTGGTGRDWYFIDVGDLIINNK
jgi:hypothetical protein